MNNFQLGFRVTKKNFSLYRITAEELFNKMRKLCQNNEINFILGKNFSFMRVYK